MPNISIIIPVYKAEKYLRRCLDAVINQTYRDIEIILVDDGSPDQSGEICDEYTTKDNRIKVIHKNNAGVTEARISGLQNCSGNYVAFIDSDDYVSSNYIEHLYDCIVRYNVSIAHCRRQIVLPSGRKRIDTRSSLGKFDENRIKQMMRTDFLLNYSTALWGRLFERSLLSNEAMNMGKGLWMGEDLVTLLYIMYRLPSLYISSEPLYFYVQHNEQATNQSDLGTWNNQVLQWQRILELDSMAYLKDQLPYRIFKIFRKYLRLNATNTNSKQIFMQNIALALKHDIVHQTIINYKFKYLPIWDKALLILIRWQWYTFLFCVLKMIDIPYKLFFR